MTNSEITTTASLVPNAVVPENLKAGTHKKIFIKEYLKSFIFLAAIYALIINQAKHDKTEVSAVSKNATLQANNSKKIIGKETSLLSLINAGTSIIFHPTYILWK